MRDRGAREAAASAPATAAADPREGGSVQGTNDERTMSVRQVLLPVAVGLVFLVMLVAGAFAG